MVPSEEPKPSKWELLRKEMFGNSAPATGNIFGWQVSLIGLAFMVILTGVFVWGYSNGKIDKYGNPIKRDSVKMRKDTVQPPHSF